MNEPAETDVQPGLDPWQALRTSTQARIGLGRSGHALTTTALLRFQAAHSLARDAVHAELDVEELQRQLGDGCLVLDSAAEDRRSYLQRPDLGRRLSDASRQFLAGMPVRQCDALFVVADGLSALAVHRHAADVVRATQQRLTGWTFAPTVIARQARVALGDEIAELCGVGMVVVLIGERPGLSASDSLGLYLTYHPRPGRLDSERNCISNVRPPIGQSIEQAANTLSALMASAKRLKLTGTLLKDEAERDSPTPALPQ